MMLNRVVAVLLSTAILSSVLSACSNMSGKNNITTPGTDTAKQSSETTAKNVPSFTLPSETVYTESAVTDPPSIQTNDTQQIETTPQITDPSITSKQTPPATSPVPQASTSTQQTNANGEIIDDYRVGLDLSTIDPSELYSAFGVDKTSRQAYYQKISEECDLPIIHVSTENKQEVLSKENYVNCFVEIFNCDDIYKLDASAAGIRVRGNASAYYGDVDQIRENGAPYRIKFQDKQSMLGLNDFARCRSWVLLKTYETGVRDHLAFELGKAINEGKYYCSDSAFVQVYINEKYMGIYLLCEQTQENSSRIDINEAKDGYEGTDIGYLVELDNYASSDDPYFRLNYNKEEITDVYGTTRVPRTYSYTVRNDLFSDAQLKFIERYFEIVWEIPMRAIKYGEFYTYDENYNLVPAQDSFASAYDCINAIIDVESVVDMYINYEIVNDQDVGGGSFFFAVDFGEDSKYKKVTMVAPWDFSWAYTDYNSDSDGGLYAAKFKDSYFVDHWGDRSNPWLILFYSADWFQDLVKQKWQERYTAILETLDNVENTVNTYKSDFNKDGTHRSSRAITTVEWTRNRVNYLNTLWG